MTNAIVAQKAPYSHEVAAGKTYYWCACGHSKTQPYCDGSHKTSGTGLTPIKAVIEIEKRVAWCGCKHSSQKPFCDGTHRKLPKP